jgi:TonB family protein
MSEGHAAQTATEPGLLEAPTFQYELEPRGQVLRRNLADLILRREPPPLELTSAPAPVPSDIFVDTSLNWWGIAESYGSHIIFVAVVYFVSVSFFQKPVQLQSPFQNTEISYYPVSEYLPPINTGQKGAAKPRKGEPRLAKQEILSVPPNADNRQQTIVTPPNVKLNKNVAVPNIVAWTPVPAVQPIAASSQSVSQLKIPQFQQQVVEPTADVSGLKPKLLVPPELRPTVVEPRADLSQLKTESKAPNIAQPAAVEPAVSADALKLKAGQLNMTQLAPQVEAPKLAVAPQVAGNAAQAGTATGKAGAPPQPSMQGLSNSRGQGQLIALGVNPADVRGPVDMPGGNRNGEFHVSPGGKADAPGTPNVKGDTSPTANGAGGSQGKGNGSGNGGSPSLPTGISVGNPPPGAGTSAVAGTPNGKPSSEEQRRIIAAAMRPSIPSSTQRPVAPPEPPANIDPDSIDARVFGRKQYYSLVLNMPNLSSRAGSWVIHFAELKESDNKTKPTPPVALNEVDPAYTADAMRDRVEGTVTLYAVIRPDGSVTDIKVLNSLDDRLDSSAMRALSHWHFRPGTKNGEPIALEAVVQIPFRMKKY